MGFNGFVIQRKHCELDGYPLLGTSALSAGFFVPWLRVPVGTV